MKTRITRIMAIALCAFFIVGTAVAQPGMGFGFFDEGPCPEKGEGKDAKELLSTIYLMELVKELDLTKEQAIEISQIIEKEKEQKTANLKSLQEAVREVRHELAKDNPSEKDLKKWVKEVTSTRDKMKADETKTRDAILAKLNVTQQAKFMLFHMKWMRKMHRIKEHIEGERMRKGGRGGPGGRGGQLGDDQQQGMRMRKGKS
ncbi:MAG: hypothetical protein JW941_13515 [Candidatus Coatesbacteria bacterium]|nr:hypothetical protein [Candidatus Coatesbacteria bacterium]